MEEKIYKCKYCGKEYSSPKSLAAHCSHCKYITLYEHDIPRGKALMKKEKSEHTQKCKCCGKEFIVLCTDAEFNSQRIKKFCSSACRKQYMITYMTGNPVYGKHNIGKARSDETKQKISISRKRAEAEGRVKHKVWTEEERIKMSIISKEINKRYWTEERRKEQSEKMKRIAKEKYSSYSTENVSGRVKFIDYNGYKLHGNWELIVAKWLDNLGLTWTNKVTGIPYFYDNSEHMYFPDFYIPSLDLYIEVKGYETSKDFAKWNACKNNNIKLIVLKKKEVYQIINDDFISLESFNTFE